MHTMPSRHLPALAAAALLALVPAHAQDNTAEVDKIFSWVKPDGPGCVAAASRHGKLVVNRAYGLADIERRTPLTTDTVFDVGSVRKQFVAAAVLLLVDQGRLSLRDDVRKHIPELPDYGHTITVDHLLTHTSGIRDWVPLLNIAGGDPDAMSLILRQRGLNFVPGEAWSYSNSGYVLLPEIVRRVSGVPFPEFLRTRVLEPLGMTLTTYVDDPQAAGRNLALAYEPQGSGWRVDMLLGKARGGAGALLSTASDLLIWNDALDRARLGRFVSEKIQEPARLSNGRTLPYARGLIPATNYAGRLIWHGGSAAAYKSVTGRFVDQGVSVAVLCNAGDAADARSEFAGRIFDLFMADKGLRRPAADAAAADAGAAPVDAARAGLFFNERTGEPLRLGVSSGRLMVAGAGPLVALTPDRFRIARPTIDFMSNDAFEIRFVSNDQIELTSMEGAITKYRRAQPYAPGPADLQAFAGRYESDELRAVIAMAPGAGGLSGRLNDAGAPLPFRPVDRDTFQFSGVMLRFHRDQAGNVVSLDFSNPLLRNIRFTRSASR